MALIRVVCGLIFNDEKILICRRKEGKSLAGFWEFPGGKVERNESDNDALVRELLEELDMDVNVHEHFTTVEHQSETLSIELVAINCTFVRSSFTLTDHDRYEWIGVDELPLRTLAVRFFLTPAELRDLDFVSFFSSETS